MIYIPMLKGRQYEIKFIKDYRQLFGEDIFPLIELINLKFGRKTYLDEEIEELLGKYDNLIQSLFFLDFFTFIEGDYKPFDGNSVIFPLAIRDEKQYKYFDLLSSTIQYENCVPVISIKMARDFLLNKEKLTDLIISLQKIKNRVAIRIECKLFASLSEVIIPLLRKDDYFMFDLGEEKIDVSVLDLLELKGHNLECNKIILNSPRLRKINNGLYIDGDYTDLIDNSIRAICKKEGFDGFGDYAGLKDMLPTGWGVKTGAALGLLFDDSENKFYSIVNKDTSQGIDGYEHVVNEMFKDETYLKLNFDGTCLAYEYVEKELKKKGRYGVWGTWKYITILRYIDQINKSKNYL